MLHLRKFVLRNRYNFNVRQCIIKWVSLYSKCYEVLQYAPAEFRGKYLFIIATLTHAIIASSSILAIVTKNQNWQTIH